MLRTIVLTVLGLVCLTSVGHAHLLRSPRCRHHHRRWSVTPIRQEPLADALERLGIYADEFPTGEFDVTKYDTAFLELLWRGVEKVVLDRHPQYRPYQNETPKGNVIDLRMFIVEGSTDGRQKIELDQGLPGPIKDELRTAFHFESDVFRTRWDYVSRRKGAAQKSLSSVPTAWFAPGFRPNDKLDLQLVQQGIVGIFETDPDLNSALKTIGGYLGLDAKSGSDGVEVVTVFQELVETPRGRVYYWRWSVKVFPDTGWRGNRESDRWRVESRVQLGYRASLSDPTRVFLVPAAERFDMRDIPCNSASLVGKMAETLDRKVSSRLLPGY